MNDIYTEFAPESAAIAAYLREACALDWPSEHKRCDAFWRNANENELYAVWSRLGMDGDASNGPMIPNAIMNDFRTISARCHTLLA